jgi:hypothetical protein
MKKYIDGLREANLLPTFLSSTRDSHRDYLIIYVVVFDDYTLSDQDHGSN